ncbi:MAG TPA: MATE family efflux transporter [Bacillales bacterium]|nr:MATE family efflux transporter [Bacillales bacterium]
MSKIIVNELESKTVGKINELEQKSIGKLLAHYSIPTVLGLIVNSLYQVVDRIYIGHIEGVGALALTGIGYTTPITTVILAISALIAVGASSTISIRLGEKQKEAAEETAGNAFTFVAIISLVITVLFFIFKQQIYGLLGITGQARPYADSYISLIVLGTIFNMFSFALPTIIRADGSPTISAAITLTGCIVNIILDAVLIFVLNMGIAGAAIATVVSQVIVTAIGFVYFISKNAYLRLVWDMFRPVLSTLKSIVKIGIVPFTNQLSISISQLVGNYSLALHGGELSVGAMTAINSIIMIFLMPINGVGQGLQPIAGYNFAKKNYSRTFGVFKLALACNAVILLVGLTLIQIFPTFWVSLFINDPSLVSLTVDGLRKFTILLPLATIVPTSLGFMMMTGKEKSSVFLSIFYQIGLSAIMIYSLPLILGMDGLWYSRPVADIIGGALTLFLFMRGYGSVIKEMRKEQIG